MVPTLQCGLVRSNFSFAISLPQLLASSSNPKTFVIPNTRACARVRNLLSAVPTGLPPLLSLPRAYALGYLYAAPKGAGSARAYRAGALEGENVPERRSDHRRSRTHF